MLPFGKTIIKKFLVELWYFPKTKDRDDTPTPHEQNENTPRVMECFHFVQKLILLPATTRGGFSFRSKKK